MRQVILIPSSSTFAAASTTVAAAANKSFGFAKRTANGPTFTRTAGDLKVESNFVLKRAANDLDVVPFIANKFSYSKSHVETLANGATGVANFTDVTFTPGYDYSIVFVKKGKKFNERSNWSFSYRADSSTTAAIFALAVKAFVEANDALELSCAIDSNIAGKVTFATTSEDKTTAYNILFTDSLVNVKSSASAVITSLEIQPALVSDSALNVADVEKYVKDLYEKACADRGIEYTYEDVIYPSMQGGSLDLSAFSSGAYVYTLFFVEPRQVKTRDDVVKQIIQIVIPDGVTVTDLDTLLAAI